MSTSEINANNIVEKISEQVKNYPNEPVYQVYVNNSLCLYELLINDAPMALMDEYKQQATPYHINHAILKSGKQKITLRLYPAPAEFNNGKEVFSPNTKCSVEVRYYNNKNIDAQPVDVAKFELPSKTRMAGERNDVEIKEFEGEGKKYYEAAFTFDAEVPYHNQGWSAGQDLSKLDQKLLLKMVVDKFKERKEMIEKKNMNVLAVGLYPSFKEQMISEYQPKSYIQNAWDEYTSIYRSGSYTFKPLENYKMIFYGNNKMVTLVNASQQMNITALEGKFKDSQGSGTDFIRILLYLPEGKKLEQGLEPIR